jgi:hypothetical protein
MPTESFSVFFIFFIQQLIYYEKNKLWLSFDIGILTCHVTRENRKFWPKTTRVHPESYLAWQSDYINVQTAPFGHIFVK